jgi:hypothetical protein
LVMQLSDGRGRGSETRFFCLPGKICRLSRVKRGWA